ncbi:hypothetical protein [Saccharopolyspora flava]|uniref:Nudix hydrolase domain-containing protein n=1 Tax=Saccharopolyspora flava TaxID=95161 RepID=A0A1I6S5K8_9PSEU|nr:hypothetical protein [Saccharopolyspora flava]SFS72216.1 hypothetical protein SAMN05660874_02907 [Saccharopolyspora flava]
MRKLVRRGRSGLDRAVFAAARAWPLSLVALGALLIAVVLLPTAAGIAAAVLVLVPGGVLLTTHLRGVRGRWAGHDFSPAETPFPHTEIGVPAAYPDARYVPLAGRGTALLSDEIDHAVRERRFAVRLDERPYRPAPRLRATAPHLPALRSAENPLFNGPVVGLRTDPLPGTGDAEVRLHRARYFDFQCTNELCGLRIADRESGAVFDPHRELLTDAAGRLRPLDTGELADVVGISTLAFTTDGLLVIVGDGDPSGSGSLEPRDLLTADGAPRGELGEVLRTGMERELREETGLARGSVAGTELTGFARWMERGAKPEFFGITRLSVSSASLHRDEVSFLEVDLATLSRELRTGSPLLDAPSLPQPIREHGSLPLLLAVRAAALR